MIGYTLQAVLHYTRNVHFTRNDMLHLNGSATLYRQWQTLPEMTGFTLMAVLHYTGNGKLYQK